MILALDPGECTGWAIGQSVGRLHACGAGAPPFVAEMLYPWVPLSRRNWRCVIEFPSIRRGTRNPNSIVRLAWTAGGLAAEARLAGWAVEEAPVMAWKGNRAKEVHHVQIRRVLSPEELRIVDSTGLPKSKLHNTMDAVGLFLWAVMRMR